MVKERSVATAAENRPVYSVLVYAQDNTNSETRTHKDEDPVSIPLPTFDHLVVFIFCGLGIHGEKGLRAVTEVGFYLWWPIWCQLRVVVVQVQFYICYRRHQLEALQTKCTGNTYLGHFPSLGLGQLDETLKRSGTHKDQGRSRE